MNYDVVDFGSELLRTVTTTCIAEIGDVIRPHSFGGVLGTTTRACLSITAIECL